MEDDELLAATTWDDENDGEHKRRFAFLEVDDKLARGNDPMMRFDDLADDFRLMGCWARTRGDPVKRAVERRIRRPNRFHEEEEDEEERPSSSDAADQGKRLCRISPEMIRESALQGDAPDQEKVDYAKIESLSLGFKNIGTIDNLQSLTNLKRLELNNNFIRSISGLETLIHLTWLDLSFNEIRKIEGLDHLGKLECLLLFGNDIKRLRGMEKLKSLRELSLGLNSMTDVSELVYLRPLRSLCKLTLAGNLLAEDAHHQLQALALVPSLQILDDVTFTDALRDLAKSAYAEEMRALDLLDAKDEQDEALLNDDAPPTFKDIPRFVDEFASLSGYESALELKESDRPLFDRIPKAYSEKVAVKFNNALRRLKSLDESVVERRRRNIATFFVNVNNAIAESKSDTIKALNKYLKHKGDIFAKAKGLFFSVDKLGAASQFATLVEAFGKNVDSFEKSLADRELKLSCHLETLRDTLETTLAEIVDEFSSGVKEAFKALRGVEEERLHDMLAITSARDPRVLLFDDQEARALQRCVEERLALLDARRDSLLRDAEAWRANFGRTQLARMQARSRAKMLETKRFIGEERKQLSKLYECSGQVYAAL